MANKIKGDKVPKTKRTFLLPPETIDYLKQLADKNDFSINDMLDRCILGYGTDDKIKINKVKEKFKPCPIKYGQSGKVV
jgi:hypothetical protein